MSKAKAAVIEASVGVAAALLLAACGVGSAPVRSSQGQLAPCPSAPRCVSSTDVDPKKRIEPFYYRGSRDAARQRLLQIVAALPRAQIVASEDEYIRAEFSTAMMGFVDDVEFLLPASAKIVHVRSASRVGYYDLGVNRERVETIRDIWAGAGAR